MFVENNDNAKWFPAHYETYEKWNKDLHFILDNFEKMVKSEANANDSFTDNWISEYAEEYKKATELFGKILPYLWD